MFERRVPSATSSPVDIAWAVAPGFSSSHAQYSRHCRAARAGGVPVAPRRSTGPRSRSSGVTGRAAGRLGDPCLHRCPPLLLVVLVGPAPSPQVGDVVGRVVGRVLRGPPRRGLRLLAARGGDQRDDRVERGRRQGLRNHPDPVRTQLRTSVVAQHQTGRPVVGTATHHGGQAGTRSTAGQGLEPLGLAPAQRGVDKHDLGGPRLAEVDVQPEVACVQVLRVSPTVSVGALEPVEQGVQVVRGPHVVLRQAPG